MAVALAGAVSTLAGCDDTIEVPCGGTVTKEVDYTVNLNDRNWDPLRYQEPNYAEELAREFAKGKIACECEQCELDLDFSEANVYIRSTGLTIFFLEIEGEVTASCSEPFMEYCSAPDQYDESGDDSEQNPSSMSVCEKVDGEIDRCVLAVRAGDVTGDELDWIDADELFAMAEGVTEPSDYPCPEAADFDGDGDVDLDDAYGADDAVWEQNFNAIRWVACYPEPSSDPAACPFAEHDEAIDCPLEFIRGDVDGDGVAGLNDAIVILDSVHATNAPLCREAADVDKSGRVDLVDALNILHAAFTGDFEIEEPAGHTGPSCRASCYYDYGPSGVCGVPGVD